MALVIDIATLVLALTIAVGVSAAFLAWRDRSEPGATPLVAMLAGQSWWSVCLVFQLEASTLAEKTFWVNVSWIGVVIIPVAWLLFALEYTGRDRYITPTSVGLLSVVPAITIILAALESHHSLLYTDASLAWRFGAPLLSQTPGPWFWVIGVYTYLLGLLGAIPLFELLRSETLPFRGQSIALLVGTLAPWVSNALFLAGVIPSVGPDPTPIAFAVSGVAYLGAITRFRLLGTSPSPNRRARRLVFERLEAAAVVVDRHDYIVDMNDSAADVFGVARVAALGSPAHEWIPEYERLEGGAGHEPVTIRSGGEERPFDVTMSRIDDVHGRLLGTVYTFHDIGEYLRQQQRLEVLNRVFRHNIRTETNIISGYADLMNAGEGAAKRVQESAARIAETGEKARRITDIFDQDRGPTKPVPLADLLEKSASAVASDFPNATIAYDDTPSVAVSGVLEHVFLNLVENAAEHNTSPDPWVRIECVLDGRTVHVTVRDNGPGIDQYEREVLERGSESALEHASGLGLWLVTWATDIADGRVSFEENEPRGSAVTVSVPVLDGDAASESENSGRENRETERDPDESPAP